MKFIEDAQMTVKMRGYDHKIVKQVTSISGRVFHDDGYRIAEVGDVFGLSQADYDVLAGNGSVVDVDDE